MAAHRGHAVPARVSAECAIVRASGQTTTEWVRVKPSGSTSCGTTVGLTGTVGRGTSRRTRAPVEDHLCAHGSVRRGRGMWRSMRRATASPPRRRRSPASRRATRSARPRHRHSPISSAISSGRPGQATLYYLLPVTTATAGAAPPHFKAPPVYRACHICVRTSTTVAA